jgi:NADPH:quinone reductase-like Zn-dependent oxidoreductase
MRERIEAVTPRTSSLARNESQPGKMELMKAVRIHNHGGPEVLQYEDAPHPQLGNGEVLIRVHAAGVNPADWKVREGHLKQFVQHGFPFILGWDLSGVIEEVGANPAAAERFKKGDEVFSKPDTSRDGAYAEYIVVRDSEVALKPKSLHHVYAAAVPLAGLTAWQALFDLGQLQPGQRILIHGGSGGVGHFAVQLARWKGAYVIATASTKNQELLRHLGAHEAIDYTKQRFEDVVGKIDIVLDTIGSDTQERSWKVLKKGGLLASVVQPPDDEKAKEFAVRGAFVWIQPNGIELAEISSLIDSGDLKVVLDRILPLSEARRAHELSQSGHARGKIVLRVKED